MTEYLIIGGGIIGLSIAREIKLQKPSAEITILEKELDVAYHSSGRNSGVLHAGFYYTSNSLKAKFTKDGNAAMRKYCYDNSLHIRESRKVVVTKNEFELKSLFELEKRGLKNGVEVSLIDSKELKEIEPNAKTFEKALYSPSTATVDPIEINKHIKNELIQKGVKFYFNESYYSKKDSNTILTNKGNYFSADKIINCAGLYADKIAMDFGFSSNYTIIPFKGVYLKYTNNDKPVNTNVYPVPNLKNPFLGVHFTITVDGTIKIGPTSIPAFWRENYKGFSKFKFDELFDIIGYESKLFFTNAFNFRDLAFEEIKKYNRVYFRNMAKDLVHNIDVRGFTKWSKPGIRAQLLNKETFELVSDFVVEGDSNSIHVLNAVSPAFTSSFPFAKWIVNNYINIEENK